MRPFAIWLNRLLWTSIVTVVVTVGAVVALGRHYFPYLDRYQDALLVELRERTGLIVSASEIRAEWRPLQPRLEITGLALHHPERPDEVVARLERLALRLDLLESLRRWVPAFSGVEGSGLRVVLEEQPLGRWQLQGFPLRAEGSVGGTRLLEMLLAIRRADIGDSRIDLHFYHGGRGELIVDQLALERTGRFRRLQLAATTATGGAPLQVTVESHGSPLNRDAFHATAYAEFAELDLTSVLPAAKSFGFDLRHGLVSGRAWLNWERGGGFTVRGGVEVPRIDLAALIGREASPLADVRASFLMSEQPGHRELWLSDISADWGGLPVTVERLWLRQRGETPEQFEVGIPELDLAQVRALVDRDPLLPAAWHNAIAGLAPAGMVRSLHLRLPTAPRHLDRVLVRAEVEALQLQPWREAPGITGGRGYVELDLHGGRGWVDAPELSLVFPSVYNQPIALRNTRGRVDWRIDREAARVGVASSALQAVTTEGAPATVRLTLDLPLRPAAASPPAMTLLVGMGETTAAAALAFVPKILPASLRDWLAEARPSGAVRRAGFVFRGSLRAGDDDGRTVQLFTDIRDGGLSFHPDWPRLEQANGQLWIDDGRVAAIATSGRLLDDLLVEQAQVEVDIAEGAGPRLTLVTVAAGKGQGWLRLFQETPLRQQLGDWIDALQWQGGARAELALTAPLAGEAAGAALGLALRGELNDGVVLLREPSIRLTAVSGAVTYRQGVLPPLAAAALQADELPMGLAAPALTAQLHDRPLTLAVATTDDGYQFTAQTRTSVVDWADFLPAAVPALLPGTAAVAITGGWHQGRGRVTLESDLRGVQFDLPAPFHKLAETTLPLRATVALSAGTDDRDTLDARQLNERAAVAARLGRQPGDSRRAGGPRIALDATLGEWAALAMEWRGVTARRGTLRLGGESAELGQRGVFTIVGQLPPLTAAPWRALGEQFDFTTAGANGSLALLLEDIRSPELTLFGRQLADVAVSGGRSASGWRLAFSSDVATGEVRVPIGVADPIPVLQLRELRLPGAADSTAADGAAGTTEHLSENSSQLAEPADAADPTTDPRRLMALDVDIAALWIGEQNWGSLGFWLRPVPGGVSASHLSGELRGLRLAARGDQPAVLTWLRTPTGDRASFDGRLAVDQLGRTLEQWGFEPVIQARNGWLDADVSWPGGPRDFAVEQLTGAAALQLREGRFLKAPGSASGALKVVGVFNLANVLRRLRLDFSDLFNDGISYDEIAGSFQLRDGTLTTVQPLSVVSPSSRFRLQGDLDFNAGAVDMELVATLPLATNLPWVAVVAGGLPAAAGIYVVSKLLGDEVDRFSSAVYSVEGSWQEPEIRFRRLFGDGEDDTLRRESTESSAESPAEIRQ